MDHIGFDRATGGNQGHVQLMLGFVWPIYIRFLRIIPNWIWPVFGGPSSTPNAEVESAETWRSRCWVTRNQGKLDFRTCKSYISNLVSVTADLISLTCHCPRIQRETGIVLLTLGSSQGAINSTPSTVRQWIDEWTWFLSFRPTLKSFQVYYQVHENAIAAVTPQL